MLRQVFIYTHGNLIYKRNFGRGLDEEGLKQAYKQVSRDAFKLTTETTKYHDFFQYRIHYHAIPAKELIFMFISDLSDEFKHVKKELNRCRKEFMSFFGEMLDEELDEDEFEIFDPTIDLIHKNLRPKISLIGFSGVGKTTITRLITAQDIPTEHVPTITGDIGTIKIGKLHFHLWDFAGQEQFSFLWNNFIKGSDAVLLITDSTLENCEKSKYFIELIKKESPNAHSAVIGNKQDLPEAMPIADIERLLGLKAYSMIAVDPDNRVKMITIIADILEMSGEVSPLLKPLLERDLKLKQAEQAIENEQFQVALTLFQDLADLSIELGDDRVSQDFHDKAEKIRELLKTMPAQPEEEKITLEEAAPELEPGKEPSPPPVTPPLAPSVSPPPMAVPPGKPPLSPPPAPPISPLPMVAPPEKPPLSPPPVPPMAAPPEKPPLSPPPVPPIATPPVTPPVVSSQEPADKLDLLLTKLQDKKEVPVKVESSQPESVLGKGSSFSTPIGTQPPVSPPPALPSSPSVPPVTPPPVEPSEQALGSTSQSDSKKIITELKIKIAKVNQTLLDMEMDNITGDLSDDEYANKSARLDAVKGKLQKQIEELENL